MKRRIWMLTLMLACLATVSMASVHAATWTFAPEIRRLDAAGAALPEGEAKVTRESLRVGLYMNVTTDGVAPIDDSALGFEGLSGAIHFSSDDAAIAAAIGGMMEHLNNGDGWTTSGRTNFEFNPSFDADAGPPNPGSGTDDSWLFLWLDFAGTGDRRGAWCVPSGDAMSCRISLGVLEVPLGDLAADAEGTLTLSVGGISSAAEPISVAPMHNRATERVAAGNSIAYTICPASGCPVEVTPVTATFATASHDASEGESIQITVNLDTEPGREVTIPIRAEGASADLYRLSAESLTFGPEQTGRSLTVTAADDDADANPESVVLTLSFGALPDGVSAGADGTATVTLNDDDDPRVTVTFDRTDYAAMEGGEAFMVTVSLSGAPERELTIPITVEERDGASAGDYLGVPASVTFGPDEIETSFAVTAVEEDDRDRGESLVLSFGALPEGVTAGATASATVMLLDNDSGEALVVMLGTPSAASVEEGGAVSIPVRVHPVPEAAVLTVAYRLIPGTASAADYSDGTGGSVTIRAGQSSGTIRVTVADDKLAEPDETFRVMLMEVASSDDANEPAELGPEASRAADLTITASDPLMVSLSGPARVSKGRTANYTVSVDGGVSTADVTVALAVGMGSTADARDFDDLPEAVTVPAGQTRASFQVDVLDDGSGEGGQLLVVEIAGVTGGGGEVSVNPAARSVRTTIVEVDLDGRARAMKFGLAGFGRVLGDDVVDMIGERAEARGRAGSFVNLAGRSVDPVDSGYGGEPGVMGWVGGAVKWLGVDFDNATALARDVQRVATSEGHRVIELPGERELMTRSAFQLVLNQNDRGASGRGGQWTLWGRGDMGGFDGRFDDDFSMDGEVFAAHLGVDYRLARSLLVGVAASSRQGTVEYDVLGVGAGDVEMDLNSVHPYLNWSPSRLLDVWGTIGTGQGGASLVDDSGPVETDLKMFMAAAGTRGELLSLRGVDLALKADAFQVRIDADGREGLPGTEAEASRLRLALDGRTSMALGGGARLAGGVEVGVRVDDGDAETGVGTELGASVGYTHPGGLSVVARGRFLLTNGENEFDQWGASVAVTLDPGAAGRGLQFKLVPTYGKASSGMDALWNNTGGPDALLGSDTENALSMAARVGYGVDLPGLRGVLTPFGEMDLHAGDPRRLRLGAEIGRWRLGRSTLGLELYGERRSQAGGARPVDRRVVMNARWNF